MRLHYYAETDSLYVELKSEPGTETREISEGLNVDLHAARQVVGFDFDHASQPARSLHAGSRGHDIALLQGRVTRGGCPEPQRQAAVRNGSAIGVVTRWRSAKHPNPSRF